MKTIHLIKRVLLRGGVVSAMVCSLAASALAETTNSWIDTSGTGSWQKGSNWTPSGSPASGNSVAITNYIGNGNELITNWNQAITLDNLTIFNNSGTGTYTLLTSGMVMQVTGNTVIGTNAIVELAKSSNTSTLSNNNLYLTGNGAIDLNTSTINPGDTLIVAGNFTNSSNTQIYNSNGGGGFAILFSANQAVTNNGLMSFASTTGTGSAGDTSSVIQVGTTLNTFYNNGTFVDALTGTAKLRQFTFSNQFVNAGLFVLTNSANPSSSNGTITFNVVGIAGTALTNTSTGTMLLNVTAADGTHSGDQDASQLNIQYGGMVNSGTIILNSTANNTAGINNTIALSDSAGVFSNAAGGQLILTNTNLADFRIQAANSVNDGTISVQSGNLRFQSLGGAGGIDLTNAGTIYLNNGNLAFEKNSGSNGGTFDNMSGGVLATTSGVGTNLGYFFNYTTNSVLYNSTLNNYVGGTILASNGTLVIEDALVQNGTLTVQQGGTVMVTQTNGNTGVYRDFVNGGTVALNGGTVTFNNLTNTSVVTGNGTLNGSGALFNLSTGTVIATNGTLTLASVGQQSGTFTIFSGSTMKIGTSGSGLLTNNGALLQKLAGTATLTAGTTVNYGTLALVSGGTFTISGGSLTNASTGYLQSNGGVLSFVNSSFYDASTASNSWNFNTGTIVFQGGSAGTFSSASANLGNVFAGTNQNFFIDNLALANSANITLAGGSVLYVSNLVVASGTSLNLAGRTIYFDGSTNLAGSVTLAGGQIIQLGSFIAPPSTIAFNQSTAGVYNYEDSANWNPNNVPTSDNQSVVIGPNTVGSVIVTQNTSAAAFNLTSMTVSNGNIGGTTTLVLGRDQTWTNSTIGAGGIVQLGYAGDPTATGLTLNTTLAINNGGTLEGSGTISGGAVVIAPGGTVVATNLFGSGVTTQRWTSASPAINSGNIIIAANAAAGFDNGIQNNGSIALQGGTLFGNGLSNNAAGLIGGIGTVASTLVNLGAIEATNGTLTFAQMPVLASSGNVNLRSGGTLQFGLADEFVVTNNGAISLYGGTAQMAELYNLGTVVSVNGGGLLSNALLNAAGGSVLATNGTLDVAPDLQNFGTVTVGNAATLDVAAGVTNAGTINLHGGTLVATSITNTSTILGQGTINGAVINTGAGVLDASNGTLQLLSAPTGNGTLRVENNSTLLFSGIDWTTTGSNILLGGTLQSGNVTNNQTIIGSGTLTGYVINNGSIIDTNGTLHLQAGVTNNGLITVDAQRLTNGAVSVNAGTIVLNSGTLAGSQLNNTGTISGSGTLAATINNQGTILATGGNITFFNPLTNSGVVVAGGTAFVMNNGNVTNSVINSGTFQVNSGTGTFGNFINTGSFIVSQGASAGTFSSSGGVFSNAVNGQVLVNSGTLLIQAPVINLGTINATGTGVFGTQGGVSSFNNAASGTIQDTNGSTLGIQASAGTFMNAGTIAVNNGGAINLINNGGPPPGGGGVTNFGQILIGNATSVGVVNEGTLVNEATLAGNGTLSLFGSSGKAQSVLNDTTATLNVLNGSTFTITNIGGTLTQNGLTAQIVNNGAINIGVGSTLTLIGGTNTTGAIATITNLNAGTVQLNGATLNFISPTVSLLSNTATGFLTGSGIISNANVYNSGTITVTNGTLSFYNGVVNAATINIFSGASGAYLAGGTVSNLTTGLIEGNGTVSAALVNLGTVESTNGTLTLLNVIGTGNFAAAGGSTLTFDYDTTVSSLLNPTGATIVIAASLTNNSSFNNQGTLVMAGGKYVSTTLLTNGLGASILGYGAVNFSPTLVNQGSLIATGSQALVLSGSFIANKASGILGAENGNLVVAGVLTNNGTLSFSHSVGTFTSAVVNNGAWVSDPSTNAFQNTYTVTSGGYIAMNAGDVYIFTNGASTASSFVNLSTQSNSFNTLPGKFLFDSTLAATQTFYTAGDNIGDLNTTGGFTSVDVSSLLETAVLSQYSNNFTVGTLELNGSGPLLVADAAVTGGRAHSTTEAALFIDTLDLDPGAQLIISNNTQVYFINSNDFSAAQVTLLGNAGLHQLESTAAVPEPGTLLLWFCGAAVIYGARRRRSTARSQS